MTFTTVQSRLVDGAGQPLPAHAVTAHLVSPAGAFYGDGTAEVIGVTAVTTGRDGSWELSLKPNVEVTPAGTYYTITERGTAGRTLTHTAAVPVSGAPVWLADIVVDPAVPGGLAAGGVLAGTYPNPTLSTAIMALIDGKADRGGLTLDRVADAALSGQRVVTATGATTVGYASATNPTHAAAPLWLTLNAAASGQPVAVQAYGLVTEPSWSWTPGLVYLGTAGVLTQTVPTTPAAVFCAAAGVALTATAVLFDPRPSITLT